MELHEIHQWLISKPNPVTTISEIKKKFSNLNIRKENIIEDKELFWTAESNGNIQVRPKIFARFCEEYLSKEYTCKGNCNKLHFCPKYLLCHEFCKKTCRKEYSHNIYDKHNKRVIATLLPSNVNCKNKTQLLPLLRASFPRTCKMFVETGKCYKLYCGYLHVCLQHLKGECIGKCDLASKIGIRKAVIHDYSREHNKKVLENFGFQPGKWCKQELVHNVLIPNNECTNMASSGESDDDDSVIFPMNDNQRSIHNWLSKTKFVKADLHFLSSQFPRVNNLLSVLQSNPSMFWVSQTSTDNYEIRPKVNVKLCINHVNGKRCNGFCNQLHLCKQFLFSSSSCKQNNCPYGHDISLSHNQNVLRSVFPNNYDETVKVKILRASFPRLCKDLTNKGNCTKPSCGNFHLCKENVQGKCQRGEDCLLASLSGMSKGVLHNVKSEHNKKVADMFELNGASKDEIFSSILVNDGGKVQKKLKNINDVNDNNGKSFRATFAPEKNGMITKELYSENKKTKYEQAIPEQTNVGEKHEVAKEKLPVVKPRISFDSGRKLTDTTWEPPSEIDVLKLIIQPPLNGLCSTGNRYLLQKFFRNRKAFGMTWFRDHSHTFRLDGDKVFLCVENILPCYDYWSTECEGLECDRFHICKQCLHNVKHSEISCKFSHNFNTPHNQSVIKKLMLEPLSFAQLIILLKYRFPLVCKNYLSGDCTNGSDECSDVHICGDFVNGTCTKPHGLCSFQHYDGLTDKNAERFKRNYHIADDEIFQKCIIHFKEQPAKASAKVFTTENNFNSLKDAAICHRFLNDICEEEDDCKLLHPKSMLPYAWQYKKKDGIWKMLPPKLKVELEKCYCDPANAKFDSSIVDKSLPDLHTILDNESSSPITARYMNETVEIRRLSTKSKAIATSSENILDYLTEWKWYWKGTKWEEYNPVKNEDIEKAFLRGDAFFHFSTDEYNYGVYFDVMVQQNLGPKYFTKRKVSRRPFFSNAALSSGNDIQNIEDNKPWYWPKEVSLEGGRLEVEETKKQEIIRKFESSISEPVRVIDVAEICNIEFHQKYQSKKRQFTKKLGTANVNELTLYHGTDAAVVDGICVHNFDWRLSGKNATMYGQGSYFAKEASYSHRYTIPDPKTRFRYVFVANILAGKYTVGDTNMKRPPPISTFDSNVLYDSCVNHQTSPNIFVVFERDQCYPQYLITYVGEGERYFAPNYAMAHKVRKLKPLSTPPKRPALRPPPVSKVSNQPTSVSPGVLSSTGSASYSSYGHTTYQPTSSHNLSNTGSSSYSGHKQAKYQPTSSRNSTNTKDKSKCVIS